MAQETIEYKASDSFDWSPKYIVWDSVRLERSLFFGKPFHQFIWSTLIAWYLLVWS